jgi:hypothetical protein
MNSTIYRKKRLWPLSRLHLGVYMEELRKMKRSLVRIIGVQTEV